MKEASQSRYSDLVWPKLKKNFTGRGCEGDRDAGKSGWLSESGIEAIDADEQWLGESVSVKPGPRATFARVP